MKKFFVIDLLLTALTVVAWGFFIAYGLDGPWWASAVCAVGVGCAIGHMWFHLIRRFQRQLTARRQRKWPTDIRYMWNDNGGWTALVTTWGGETTTVKLPESFNDYDPEEDRGWAGFEYVWEQVTGQPVPEEVRRAQVMMVEQEEGE